MPSVHMIGLSRCGQPNGYTSMERVGMVPCLPVCGLQPSPGRVHKWRGSTARLHAFSRGVAETRKQLEDSKFNGYDSCVSCSNDCLSHLPKFADPRQ